MSYDPISTSEAVLRIGVVASVEMTGGSDALHITDGGFVFTADDVGQPIWVIGAAAPIGGATENGMLRTYVASVTDSTHATAGNVAVETTDPLLQSNATLFRRRGTPHVSSGNMQSSLNAHDVLSISFLDDLARPQVRQPVLFTIQGDNLFGGTIDNVEGSNVPGTTLGEWKLDCQSWDKTIYKRQSGEPTETSGSPAVSNPSAGVFVNWTVADIMRYIVVHALGSEGLDFYNLVDGPVIPTFTVSYASCGDLFDQLVKAGSDGTTILHWYTDPWKVLWLEDQGTTPAPWSVSDSDPTSILADVKCTWDRSEYINRAIVRIGNEISDPIPFTFIGDGVTKTFQTTEPVAATPVITEDGVEVSVGVQGINTGCAWYWNQGSTAITQDPAGAPLAVGVVLQVNAPVFRNGVVAYLNGPAVDESTALESGTGYYESVIQQDGPATATDGTTLAQAIATQYGVIPRRLQVRSYRPGLKIGMFMPVTLARFDIAGEDFVIDTVTITTDENVLLWTVTMVGSPFINWDYRATLAMLRPGSGGGAGGGGGIGQSGPQLFWRVIDIHDTTVGNNIGPNLPVQATGQGKRITAALREPISADLSIRVNKSLSEVGTITIPASTPIAMEVELSIKNIKFVDGQILTWDITESDGSKSKNGIAAITVEWGATDTPVTVTGMWKGPWDNSAIYAMGDSVSRDGSSWISLQDTNQNHDPSSSPDWWDLIAQKGDDGAPGVGVPAGGTAGQVLTKVSSTDYDDTWADPGDLTPLTTKGDLLTYGPSGSPAVNQVVRLGIGTNRQILTANSSAIYGVDWEGETQVEVNGVVGSIDLDVEVNENFITVNGPTSGGGGVTSVGLSMPAEFSVASSPVTTSGTIAVTKAVQSANKAYAGPTTGADAAPTFRALVSADLPVGSSSQLGAVQVDNVTITATAGVISAVAGGSGTVTSSGPPTNHQLPIWTTATNIKGITGGGGTLLQGVASADPSFTISPTLGIAGSSVGTLELANATSGTVKLSPPTGALGSAVVTVPAVTGTAAVAATSTTTTEALFATATAGAPAFRAIAAGDLPLGSSSAFGAVKVDNTTITATAGVISATAGSNSVIGTAIFSMTGGAIGNTYYSGCISSVTFVSTGKFTVNLSPSQIHFTVAAVGSDDNVQQIMMYFSGTPNLNSTLSSFSMITYSGSNLINCGINCITIFKL